MGPTSHGGVLYSTVVFVVVLVAVLVDASLRFGSANKGREGENLQLG